MTRFALSFISILALAVPAKASPPTILQGVLAQNLCTPLTSSNAPQPGSLESIWHLDEITGATTYADATASNRTLGALNPYQSLRKAKVSRGAHSGENSIGLRTTKQTTDPQTFTIVAWVKATSAQSGVIVSFNDLANGNPTKHDRYFAMDRNGHIEFGVYASNAVRVVSSPLAYNNGNWHHVAVRFTAGAATLFVDGANVASQSLGVPESYNGYWRLAGGYAVGWSGLNLNTTFWSGALDELGIFSSLLTDEEIYDLSRAPAEMNSSFSKWASAVGVWHFNELTGAYQDSSANANHAIVTATNSATGFYGAGYISSSPFFVASSATTASPDTFTVMLWMRSKTPGVIGQFGNSRDANSGDYNRLIVLETDGRISFGTFGGSYTKTESAAGFNDGNWHHIAVVFKSGEQRLYVDGQNVASAAPTAIQSFTGYWLFGNGKVAGWSYSITSTPFVGDFDEIGFWRAVLTPTEIQKIFNLQRGCR